MTARLCAWLVLPLCTALQAQHDPLQQWGQWRGPLGTGAAPHADPPVKWSERVNLRWKVELPGKGDGTPIVWGDRVYVSTAIPFGEQVESPPDALGGHDNVPVTQRQEYAVLALDRGTGVVLWHRTVRKKLPHARTHETAALAAASMATDGEHLIAYFGSQGLYGLSPDGEVRWEQDLGDMLVKHGHGEGTSPVLHDGVVVVPWYHEGPSFVAAFDAATGAERWRQETDDPTSWASPTVATVDGKAQVIVAGTAAIRGFDLATGEPLWTCGGMAHNIVASPVTGHGMVFVGSSYEIKSLLGIGLAGARGELSGTEHVVWRHRRGTPYVPSPLLYGDWLYSLGHYHGVLSRLEATTGKEPHRPWRLPEVRDIYASPVGGGNRVYVTDRQGTTVVLSHGKQAPQLLAINQLDDVFNASAALAGDELFLRGARFLYCIAEASEAGAGPRKQPESGR